MAKILAVTACPVGIAHTYMAAENLQKAGQALGIDIKVETQGSIGVENALTEQDIAEADGIIIAADKEVPKDRFAGKKIIITGVQDGVHKPEELIKKVLSGDAQVYKPEMASANKSQSSGKKENPIYKHLMSGVSYMVPFIVVGGLLIALALTLGGEKTPGGIVIPEDSIWKQIESLGGTAFMFMVPILAGFIAVSIADRPGLVPGMIGGYIAANGSFYGSEAGAGFIGGIIAGFLAGYVALAIKKIKVPKAVQPVMPIIFIPILASVIVGLLFIYVIGAPVAAVFEGLTTWLAGMQGGSSILLAIILGGMIAVDMGGPFNKVAFLFGSAMIAEGNYEIMGPIAVAICIPPIGLGLATFINKRKFRPTEQEAGKASFTMGLFGITEGAIPFAAQDPLRVIPSIVVGSMVGSVIAMISNIGDRVAHGGPIVAVLGAVDNVVMFFVAVIVGVLVTAFMVIALKKNVEGEPAVAVADGSGVVAKKPVSEQKVEKTEAPKNNNVEINKLTDITSEYLIDTELTGTTRDDVIDEMIAKFDASGVLTSKDEFKKAILNREEQSSTGLGMNIAIPHGKSSAVKHPAVAFGIKHDGVDWKSLDGTDAKLIFMIAVPEQSAGDAHLKILQMLSRKLMDEDFRNQLLQAKTKDEAYKLLEDIQ
ncbi:PTS fructose transporter subunit IIABC [Mesobacillus maritimus]|uniref:PTS fructose transporter subunit IIABC n=1 Tax=Mesobacillus maritimus TaxID=1643336 RepID=UPI00203D1F1D|nr:PTS fructose transporter subunit IIABC [Mesobacillus maritimus]MCM3670917.1 PTS fructose transporter subunit IIABC [Mesobacillus maritimus]